MTRAVIVSTARTPLCRSWKGAFNMTHGATLGAVSYTHLDVYKRQGVGCLTQPVIGHQPTQRFVAVSLGIEGQDQR